MYPFFVNGVKVFSFGYKPSKGDVIKYDKTGRWFEVIEVESDRGRKVNGRVTIELNWRMGY
ncbi:hypothetical protein [Solibacillus daqui]|uniref:hypothetical protein n=1 Tax=Solibacillus daqui TaxID=2912187 RepID=UPI00236556C4|nr:hypothetical protein [Solibacillus daqui]